MKNLSRSVILAFAALTMAGCSTHEGPPARAAKVAYLQNLSGDFRTTHFNSAQKHIERHLHVQHCAKNPTHPGLWSCEVFFQDTGGPHGMADIKLVHEGGTWKAYNP